MSDHVHDDLTALLHGELPLARRIRVQAHLRGCSDCAEELASLRRVHAALADLPLEPAPAAVWAGIESRLGRPRPRRIDRVAWAAALAAAVVLAMVVLPMRPAETPVALGPYFTRVEAEARALDEPVPGCRPASAEDAFRVVGLGRAPSFSPSEGFALVEARTRPVEGGGVAQLLYRGDGATFGIVVAPHAARLDFGDRSTRRVRMGDWECTQVSSETLDVYWSVSSLRQSVLVAPAGQDLDVAAILQFFVYGDWSDEPAGRNGG